jgi:hypothetical protein
MFVCDPGRCSDSASELLLKAQSRAGRLLQRVAARIRRATVDGQERDLSFRLSLPLNMTKKK